MYRVVIRTNEFSLLKAGHVTGKLWQ